MKKLRGVKQLAVIVFLTGLSLNTWAHTDVTPEEAKDMIDTNEELIVVDVREEESEYCDEDPTPPVPPGHIPGALNYPWASGVLEDRYSELPTGGDILVVCRSGHRSDPAASFLDSKGYLNVYDMLDGMSAWEWGTVLCIDSDSDGVNDDLDNCPLTYNEPNIGTCTSGNIGQSCTDDEDCGVDEICRMDQEDTMPSGGNDCGDACECEGDFEPDGDVDGTDAVAFKSDFFRKDCDTSPPCDGDFTCDGDVDGTDAVKFKADFFRKDCPSCGGWPCGY